MRILIFYRHFQPDTPPYASMLQTLTAHLAKHGHDVTLWTEMPCYGAAAAHAAPYPALRETIDDVRVRRLRRLPFWRRASVVRNLDKLLFPLRILGLALWARLRREKYDLVWTATMPPVINGAVGALVARVFGARFLYHYQDIYPEIGAVSGLWKEHGLLHRLMQTVERRTARRMWCGVVLSPDMAATLTARGVDAGRLRVLNNFMLDVQAETQPPVPPSDGRFRVLFAGNIGRFQGLEALVGAARLLADLPQVEICLMGEGRALPALKEQSAGLRNITFLPHHPFEQAAPIISGAAFGVVSLNPGIYRLAYPSKTLTYLGLGLPLIAVVEPQSDLARMVTEKRLGYLAAGRDAGPIAAVIREAYENRDHLPGLKANARTYYDENLSRPAVLDGWSRLLAEEVRS